MVEIDRRQLLTLAIATTGGILYPGDINKTPAAPNAPKNQDLKSFLQH